VTYDEIISNIVRGVEAVGAGIMVIGGLASLVVFAWRSRDPALRVGSYSRLRRSLGYCILLGLEVLIIGDIVRTIIVETTLESVAVLGAIVLIRIILSFSLEIEIDGVLPWRRRREGTGEPRDAGET
jgi:uncharacterized membrane protein